MKINRQMYKNSVDTTQERKKIMKKMLFFGFWVDGLGHFRIRRATVGVSVFPSNCASLFSVLQMLMLAVPEFEIRENGINFLQKGL